MEGSTSAFRTLVLGLHAVATMESKRSLGSLVGDSRSGASGRLGSSRCYPRKGPPGRHESPRRADISGHRTYPGRAQSLHWWIPRVAPSNSWWIAAIWPTSGVRMGSSSLRAIAWWPTNATTRLLSVIGSGMPGAVPASRTLRIARTPPAGTEASTGSVTALRISSNESNGSAGSELVTRSYPSTSSPLSNSPPSSIGSSLHFEDTP